MSSSSPSGSRIIWWLSRPVSPAAAVAAGVGGERWYNLTLNERHLGYWYTWNRQDEDGNWYVTGQKIFITSGHGKYHFVIARTEKAADPDDPFAGLGVEV